MSWRPHTRRSSQFAVQVEQQASYSVCRQHRFGLIQQLLSRMRHSLRVSWGTKGVHNRRRCPKHFLCLHSGRVDSTKQFQSQLSDARTPLTFLGSEKFKSWLRDLSITSHSGETRSAASGGCCGQRRINLCPQRRHPSPVNRRSDRTLECLSQREIASIHRQDGAGHPGRFIARQINCQTRYILRSAESANGMRSGSFPANCCGINGLPEDTLGQFGLYERRTNCIDPNIFMPVVDGHAFR